MAVMSSRQNSCASSWRPTRKARLRERRLRAMALGTTTLRPLPSALMKCWRSKRLMQNWLLSRSITSFAACHINRTHRDPTPVHVHARW